VTDKSGVISTPIRFAGSLRQRFSDERWVFATRVAVTLAALGILYLRTPITFHHPQFWGEDTVFFLDGQLYGWHAILLSANVAGYLSSAQGFGGFLAAYFNPIYAAAIFCSIGILLTLSVVWLLTSPRLDMPCKPLIAIAVVITPMGFEELGSLCNIQWILPVGAFALLFMHVSKHRIVLVAESIFLALSATSGPFSIFLAPLFVWRSLQLHDEPDRRHIIVLTVVVCLCALIQIYYIHIHPGAVTMGAPAAYPWTTWITLPLSHIMSTFGPDVSGLFDGVPGAVLGCATAAAAAFLASMRPYRTQKIFMLFFAVAIAVAGMYKFRSALATQVGAQRYFYVGSVFCLWFICCISARFYIKTLLTIFVGATELLLLLIVTNTPRIRQDMEWPAWASYISSGLPVVIPTSPVGWYVRMLPAKDGPLSFFSSTLGHSFAMVPGVKDQSSCIGSLAPINLLHGATREWITSGSVKPTANGSEVKLIVLVDSTSKIVGFGLTGFKPVDDEHPGWSEWRAIFQADPGSNIRAYAILKESGKICPLSTAWRLQARAQSAYIASVPILPGLRIEQSFKPSQSFGSISVTMVAFGHTPTHYIIDWSATADVKGSALELGNGKIDSSTVADWEPVNLPISVIPKTIPTTVKVSFWNDSAITPAFPAGLPMYRPPPGNTDPPAEINGISRADGIQLNVAPSYINVDQ